MAKIVGGTLPAHFDSVTSAGEILDRDWRTLVGLTRILVSVLNLSVYIAHSIRVWPSLDLKIETWPSGTKRLLTPGIYSHI